MGELEFKDFTICYQDENGEMKPLTSWDLNKNGLFCTIGTDEEQIEASENIVNNTDTVIEFNPVSISTDKVRAIFDQADIKLNYEFAEELKEELKEISREESQKVIDEKWYQWTTDTIEAICKGLQKSKEVGISAAEAIEKFAESSKLVYNKEKEKKVEKKDRTIAVVRFWDLKQNKLGTKDYYYFYNPISGHACFDDLQRKYWIRNDTGRVYENPVVFKSLVPESRLLKENLQKITKTIIEVEPFKEMINIKGDNKMNFNKIFPNAYIGKASDVRMSIYGPTFCSDDGREAAFKDGEWIDVTGFGFDFLPAFVCPVKATDVIVGDFIRHMNTWCRVIGIDGTTITAEKVYVHEIITIVPVKSMFGFDFYSKLIMPFDNVATSMEDMFSNPLMMMMLFGDSSKDFGDMLPLMLMNGGKFDMSNPMMLYFLMKGDKKESTERTTGRELGF